MPLSDLIMRLWKEDKLVLTCLVFIAGLLVWSVFQFANDYPREGWRAVLLPAICGYLFFRILQLARRRVPTLGDSTTADEANRMERAFRKAASSEQFDELVAEEGPKLLARRASLWEQAASSLKVARQLEREIRDELQAIDDIMDFTVKNRPDDKEGLQGLAQYRKELEHERERAAALIHHLRQ